MASQVKERTGVSASADRATRASPRALAGLGHTASIANASWGEQHAEIRRLRNRLAKAEFFIEREAELREARGNTAEHLRKFLGGVS